MAITARRLAWIVCAPLVLVACDQATKRAALHRLGAEGASLKLPGPIDLTLVLNRSNAFGLVPVAGEVSRWALAALNLSVAALLIAVLFRRPVSAWTAAGLVVLAAGAAANALDRLWLGVVVDFIDASKIGFHWVFNIADICIDVGIGLLLLGSFLSRPGAPGQAGG
jgi:signal peptidase II